jgi:hypothetical protein
VRWTGSGLTLVPAGLAFGEVPCFHCHGRSRNPLHHCRGPDSEARAPSRPLPGKTWPHDCSRIGELFTNNTSSNRPFAAPAAGRVTAGSGQPLAGAASAPHQKRVRNCRSGRRRDRICVPPSRADGESPVAMDLLRPVQIFMTRTGPKVLLRASISVAAGFFFRGAISPLAQPVPACGLDWQSLSRPHARPLVS